MLRLLFIVQAKVLAPCVVFIDEADGLLSTRGESDNTAVNNVKTCVRLG